MMMPNAPLNAMNLAVRTRYLCLSVLAMRCLSAVTGNERTFVGFALAAPAASRKQYDDCQQRNPSIDRAPLYPVNVARQFGQADEEEETHKKAEEPTTAELLVKQPGDAPRDEQPKETAKPAVVDERSDVA